MLYMIDKYIFMEYIMSIFGIIWLVILNSHGIPNRLFIDIQGSLITKSWSTKYDDLRLPQDLDR